MAQKEPIYDINELAAKYRAGSITPAEKAYYERWWRSFDDAEAMSSADDSQDLQSRMFARLDERINPPMPKVRSLWQRMAAAAVILMFLSAGAYFLLHKPNAPQQTAVLQKTDLLPGNQSAILQLSGGQRINLNQVKAGTIATQGNMQITKTANNSLIYNNTGASSEAMAYNTITTRRGNFYPLTLSDGTVAILDAGSSIRYPVSFSGNERRVEITGQVYFEVVHNAKMPFQVSVRGQTIEDLGTHFNINAYDDEPSIKTTLLEGSVRVNNQATLTPGQQAIITSSAIKVKQVNTEQAVAWKNGLFNFEGLPMAEAMRQLSRWYDVEVEYPQGMPKTVFHGEMHRNVNASQVLEVLRFFKVNFEIVEGSGGKKILVKP